MLGTDSTLPTSAVLREAGQVARPRVPCSPQGGGSHRPRESRWRPDSRGPLGTLG